jgi:hypothetical protein
MTAQINQRLDDGGLFTAVEHAVLAAWFGREPTSVAASINVSDALKELSFDELCMPYTQADAAVAHILLEAIEDRLPVWACRKEGEIIYARDYREPHQKPRRKATLLPGKLFTINWATSGPGFDWPVRYHLVWLPHYERFVVTASADCPDAYGYADFALGHFARTDDVGQAVIEIIKRDWCMQRDDCGQERWEELRDTGLITKAAVHQMSDEVWPQPDDDVVTDDEDEDSGRS